MTITNYIETKIKEILPELKATEQYALTNLGTLEGGYPTLSDYDKKKYDTLENYINAMVQRDYFHFSKVTCRDISDDIIFGLIDCLV